MLICQASACRRTVKGFRGRAFGASSGGGRIGHAARGRMSASEGKASSAGGGRTHTFGVKRPAAKLTRVCRVSQVGDHHRRWETRSSQRQRPGLVNPRRPRGGAYQTTGASSPPLVDDESGRWTLAQLLPAGLPVDDRFAPPACRARSRRACPPHVIVPLHATCQRPALVLGHRPQPPCRLQPPHELAAGRRIRGARSAATVRRSPRRGTETARH